MAALLANLAATWFMAGLIWFVQIVHYPLFGAVGREAFAAYHAAHTRLTTLVVGAPMLLEAATAALLLVARPAAIPATAAWAGAALLAVIWLVTAVLQVPQHGALAGGFSPNVARALVAGNWIRTAAWSARALLVLWMVARCTRA